MQLLLWRHARAADGAAGMADAQRRLTARGLKQARLVAAWLRPRLPAGTLLLASPAARCVETAQALELPFAREKRLAVGASAADLIVASGWPNHEGAVLVVGHQPTLGRLASLLLCGVEQDWSIRKGGLWWLSQRSRNDVVQTRLDAVINPDMLG